MKLYMHETSQLIYWWMVYHRKHLEYILKLSLKPSGLHITILMNFCRWFLRSIWCNLTFFIKRFSDSIKHCFECEAPVISKQNRNKQTIACLHWRPTKNVQPMNNIKGLKSKKFLHYINFLKIEISKECWRFIM